MKNKFLLALALSFMLSACASRIDTDVKPRYETKAQIPLNAAAVVVRYDFNPTVKTPQTDHLFSKTLTQGLEKWAHTRLRPTGQYGTAQVIVRDASIVEVPDYHNPEKFVGKVDVVIALVDQRGSSVYQADTKVSREISAPRNMTDEEHQELAHVLTTKLIDAFDEQMEETLFRMGSSLPAGSHGR